MLLAEGAAENTYKQLSAILRLPGDLTEIRTVYKYMDEALMINNSAVQLSTSQVLFSDANRPIELDFQYKLEHVYEADYQAVDFANPQETYDKINGYVKKKTGGRINEIVQFNDLNQAQMILISAIFFQGRWKVRILFARLRCKIDFSLNPFIIDITFKPFSFSTHSKVKTHGHCHSTMNTARLCQQYK